MKRKHYKALLQPLQEELVEMARWAKDTGTRIVILFEGRDTAGKGGVIRAMSHDLNSRQCRVVALGKPSDTEASQWYFQRYVAHLPAAGEIVLFDRSWYNRAGVEKVMQFASDAQVAAFLEETPKFERMLTTDGILLFKYWLATDQHRQEERLAERVDDPLKRGKLSPIDLEARFRYDDYTAAREDMLKATHTDNAPWRIVDFNDQKRGRLTLIRDFLDRVPDERVEREAVELEPLDGEPRRESYGVMEPIANYPI